jgi:probable rRNA maturation factor
MELLGKKDWEVSVLFCNDREIRELNKSYRNIDAATDVLSFPQDDRFPDHNRVFAGDVVVSLETAERERDREETALEDMVKRLLIHGILHLDGFDHGSDEEYNEMNRHEEHILSELKGVRIF